MAKVVILMALYLLPALAMPTRPMKTSFLVEGNVYCDTCRCGFETSATTYIAGNTLLSMFSHFSLNGFFFLVTIFVNGG